MTTYRPQGTEVLDNWGMSVIESKEFREAVVCDPKTDKGRLTIAKYHQVEREWKAKRQKYEPSTPGYVKNYDLLYLVADESKEPHRSGWDEGLHRNLAAVQALTCSKVCPVTGILEEPGSLKVQHFLDVGIKPLRGNPPTDEELLACNEKIHSGETPSPYFAKEIVVDMSWIKPTVNSVSTILDARRIISKHRSDSKILSVRKDSFKLIGELGKQFILSVPAQSRTNRPNTSGHPAPPLQREGKANVEKLLQKARNEQRAFPGFRDLHKKEFIDYCTDPFDARNEQEIIKCLSYPAVENASLTLSPPYLNTFDSLAKGPGNGDFIKTDYANAILLLPKIIHYLKADESNTIVTKTVQDPSIGQLILYGLRYQTNLYKSKLTPHGAIEAIYNMRSTANIIEKPNHILAAGITIVDTINTALSFVADEPDLPIDNINKNLLDAANMIGTIYNTLIQKSGDAKFDDVITNLSKLCHPAMFIFHFKLCRSFHNIAFVCSLPDLIRLVELEIATKIKKRIAKSPPKNDKGRLPFLEHLIYTCGLNQTMKIILHHGLFPLPSPTTKTFAPKFNEVCDYVALNNRSKKKGFKRFTKPSLNNWDSPLEPNEELHTTPGFTTVASIQSCRSSVYTSYTML